ncbi:cytochrome P450 / NADPH-cytochrome P450 reductase [Pseudonocardia thermophila]|uniref:Bifunctional cytochrome P450/NADPH--P450 reductase n=1 Tax=Pseudonocardia thermophila TaxID=1848 RepID=A0A1M6Q4K4_PSETH|nr:cytochrome P450 [Pseudonocardia thermophila]SHK15179.1 cytochrome P450 / NADPH-cytochrome P450 reductase [Pseudonocardia thermophila]
MTLALDDVPGPRGLPVLGNVFDVDTQDPIGGLVQLAEQYGPVYRLSLPQGSRLIVSSAELVAEVCDDERWDKHVGGGLSNIGGSGAGLFTAETGDPLWARAHNILMSPFSLPSMRDYLPKMIDLAEQLATKWERVNPGEEVDVPADMTRLTLDTIALCGFGYRFNSFYRETPHPFVDAMVRTLLEAQTRARQPKIAARLRIRAQRQAEEDLAFMNGLVDGLIAERRAQGDTADTSDLLGRMLTGVDSRTGERLPDDNIRAQCITFLIAGHETTSGLLSFAINYLLKEPAATERAKAEVDEVLGDRAEPTFEQIQRMTYVRQVLDESLRLWPTAPAFTRHPLADTVLGGYRVPAGTPVSVLIPALHRDPAAWGPDADRFDPDHMAAERIAALPPHAYKPFGTGQRACIGRQFALQEAVLVLATLLQRFELIDSRDYQLRTKMTLTVKPEDFHIQVRPRGRTLRRAEVPAPAAASAPAPTPEVARHGTPLAVLFGSNLGTAEAIATTLAAEGGDRGFAVTLGALDDHVGDLPEGGAAIVVSSSYNGTPPDNAAGFCRWICGDPAVPGTAYTVFGCGSTEWASTYQAVPILLDERLEATGGRRVHPRGAADARGDTDAAYRAWREGLWASLAAALELPAEVGERIDTGPRLAVTLANRQTTNPVVLSYRARPARIRSNVELMPSQNGKPPERSVRHLTIELPEDLTYRAGDHLGVLPRNGIDMIRRVIVRFGLDAGQYATIIPNGGVFTHLPVDEPAPLLGVLGSCVELQDTATRSDIEALARYAPPDVRPELEALAGDDYAVHVGEPNRSVLDLLEEFPTCALPFAEFLDMLPPLRPRYYSISSSPLVDAGTCTITAGVLRAPARSGVGTFTGVCSGHLAALPELGTAFVFVREPSIPFRPPENPHIPMIMIGAGTGLAPFRGFLQERAAQRAQGAPVSRSLLFAGCRGPAIDQLYGDELESWSDIVDVEYAYSRAGDRRRYVQDAIRDRAETVWGLLQQGAPVFVCGNAATMAPGVRAALTDVFRDRTGTGQADADAWLAGLRGSDRFLEDIWGG